METVFLVGRCQAKIHKKDFIFSEFSVTKQNILSLDVVMNKSRRMNVLEGVDEFQGKITRCLDELTEKLKAD